MASDRRHFRRLLLGATALAGVLTLATGPAAAQDRLYDFDQPAQSLDAALRAFANQAQQQVIFTDADTVGRRAPGLSGSYSADEALQVLLAGTDLKVHRTSKGVLSIAPDADPQSGSAAGDGADGTVEALIVTAQKREEDIQDVPIAISAFTQEDLTRSQVAGGPDLMTQVPNFTFTKTNFSGYSIQIRGIGTQAISATTDPAVAVAFNNTPFIRNRFFEQEFYDLQRVEVLRGPQGTLYGRNATAGVVNIISAKPAHRFEAKLSGDVGNYSSSRVEGMVNIPLIEDVAALRIAGAWTKREGYVKNLLTGAQTDGRDLWSTRVTLGLDPVDWLNVNLVWEHFEENDDRLRTGKQMCKDDPGPSEVEGIPVLQTSEVISGLTALYVSQGCLPASLYSPDSFNTPNGYALAYYGALAQVGSPTFLGLNPYVSQFQSQNLREIETHLTPNYEAETDIVELQVSVDLPGDLTLSSETGFLRDFIFSFSDYNRFDTTPGVFVPGTGRYLLPQDQTEPGPYLDIVSLDGYFCDPQLGCTNRLAAGDLSTAKSLQFSQEFRLSSNFEGPFNFNLGANFLRYDTEEKYYVFINTLTAFQAIQGKDDAENGHHQDWIPGVTDNSNCNPAPNFFGPAISNPDEYYIGIGCSYVDPNDVHNLNDQGRNYFLSKNPYHLLSYAAFGEAYYNLADNLKVTAGFRWTVDRKTAPQIPTWLLAGASYGTPTRKVIDLEWQEPTGRVAIDWKPDLSFTDETLLYGSYVRGYKAGGANPPPPVVVFGTVCPPQCDGGGDDSISNRVIRTFLSHPETFDAEFVDAYEFGTKNTFLDGTVTANLAAFYYDYRGYQISQIVNRSAVNLNFDAEVWGAEVEADWRPFENLRLAFKGGWEKTRMAEGSHAIDLMDRTAGKEGWMLVRPFPTLPSNCVAPTWIVALAGPAGVCSAYTADVDPITYLPYVPDPEFAMAPFGQGDPVPLPPELDWYPGFDPKSANQGEGFLKDLSGNELPNAPDFTATITADYTLPLPNAWLMTLHTDLYYQSEAWTRIFNTEGYDKLKAYNNANLAAIFTNEDAGWMVMAYVKNVLDKDNITGAFLNSDDSGLTTNVFLNEPRLYGLRVTKEWTGGPLLGSFGAGREGPFPITVEFGGQLQRQDGPGELLIPSAGAFSDALDPGREVGEDLDWTHGPDLRITYRPTGSSWKFAAGVRYGKTTNQIGRQNRSEAVGEAVCVSPTGPLFDDRYPGIDFGYQGKLQCDPDYGPVTITFIFGEEPFTFTFQNRYDPKNIRGAINRVSSSAAHEEDHLIVDFVAGKDVGLGIVGLGSSALVAGVRYAEFNSSVSGYMRGIPDMDFPDMDGWSKYNTTFHQYATTFASERAFTGAGPILSWEASRRLWGEDDGGHLDIDWSLTGGALFGKHDTTVDVLEGSTYFDARYPRNPENWVVTRLQAPAQAPMDIAPREKSLLVPLVDLRLGLSLEASGIKLSTGYRWERYFNVLDAGFEEHKSYDRTIDGPYFKLSVGLGG